MKFIKSLRKTLCVFLVVVLVATTFVACGNSGKPLLTIGETSISVNIYEFYLSRAKGYLARIWGERVKTDEFWETLYDVEARKTYNDFYSERVLEEVKTGVAILNEFNKLELELPQATIDKIDKRLNEYVEYHADGSKNAFNAILSDFGVNYDMLRETYIIEEKIEYFSDHLFGVNGNKIGADIVDEYFEDTYLRFRQVFLAAYEYEYEEDENGDPIYFRNDNSKISYDTTKTAKVDEDGNYVTDKNGDRVFVYTDKDGEERIAYKVADASVKHKLDANGEPKQRFFNDTEMKILNSDADAIMSEAKEGDTLGFDLLVSEYNQDDTSTKYPNGHYFSRYGNYDLMNVFGEVMEMKIGEIRKIPSDYGIHIVMRYDLQDNAYMLEGNEEFFVSKETGTYSFMPELVDTLTCDYVKKELENVVVDTELLATVDIKRTGINYDY